MKKNKSNCIFISLILLLTFAVGLSFAKVKNSTASQTTLRRWYEKGNYTEYKCSICGQEPFWNGKELTLTLDHINGDNRDDRLENLRWVCPNCDRQLDTFCSKNTNYDIRKNKKIITYCKNCGIEIS